MVVYVSHKINKNPKTLARAKRITRQLQLKYPTDCFICPVTAFYHLIEKDVDADFLFDLQRDLMDICDKLIVASDLCKSVKRELDYADLIEMEVEWLEYEKH
jgi:hypothetical protein